MTLIVTATGQSAEIEEVAEGGFYVRVAGHTRFLPSEAVTHPALLCPSCRAELGTTQRRVGGGRYQDFIFCRALCGYEAKFI